MHLREHLTSTHAFLAPRKALEGLTNAEAERQDSGLPHSIAGLVAHMAFWQDWFYARCLGQPAPMVPAAAMGWPQVAANSWSAVQSQFVDRLEALAALADGDVTKPVAPAIEFPPLAQYTIADALIHVATHNAHHLGQVVTLRQLLGRWPPPAGSFTW